MPAVSNCPKCDAQVSIPLGAPGETEVRCPLCSEEYLLQEALDKAPPELILVNPPEEGEMPVFAAGVGDTDAADDGDSDASAFDFFGDRDGGGEGEELKLEGETPSFSFGDDDSSASSADGGTATATKPRARKNRKGPGPMIQIGGIVGGGIVGLAAGYFILLFPLGKDIGADVSPDLAASKILPTWLVPEEFRDESTEEVTPADENVDAGAGGTPDAGTGGPAGSAPGAGTGGAPIDEGLGAGKKSEADPQDPFDSKKKEVEDPLGPTDPLKDDPFSIDPLPEDPTSIDPPKPPAAPKVGPKSAPSFTSGELGTAIVAVKKSTKALKESDATGREEFNLKLTLFKDLCALGETYTFAEGDDRMFQGRLAGTEGLARKADDGKLKLDEIGRLAESWLRSGGGDGQKGVLLAGTVDDVVNSGDLYKVTLLLAGTKQGRAIIICAENPTLSQLDEVLILGHIVKAPKDNLHDYSGDESVVVWARRTESFARAGTPEK